MELVILHSNDNHGTLAPLATPSGELLGGYARRATLIQQQRVAHPNVLLVDLGDIYQGSRFWHAFQGEPDIALMNLLRYDVAALGNHEFDGGLDLLAQRLKQAEFPVLCANMHSISNHALASTWQPYLIQDIAGVRIAFFSLLVDALELYPTDFAAHIACTPIVETAEEMMARLRPQADAVILLSHLGHDGDIALAEAVEGIDLIIGGHSHTALDDVLWVNRTPIVRGLARTLQMGRLQLHLEPGERLRIDDYQLIPLDATFADEPASSALVAQWEAKLPPAETLGHISASLDTRSAAKASGESLAGNFYTDALLAYTASEANLAFVHMGTLQGGRLYGPGPLTRHDLSEFHPFDNVPMLLELAAPQLKRLLEQGVRHLPEHNNGFLSQAGLTLIVDPERPAQTVDGDRMLTPGERIVRADYQGEPIDFADTTRCFYVILDGYMGGGGAGYGFLQEVRQIRTLEVPGTDILAWYLQRHSPLDLKLDGRMIVL